MSRKKKMGILLKNTNRSEKVRVFGVEYLHIKRVNGDDLYLTRYGLPFAENLMPDNFFLDKEWFSNHSKRLRGSSVIFKVRTKKINKRGIDIVLKWNRMGQEIPGEDPEDPLDWEFNSPFEEFALVMELRDTKYESPGVIYTHKPFAIYVPAKHRDLFRLGRKSYKMLPIIEAHKELELDMHRSYAVIYEWVKGIDAEEAADMGIMSLKEISGLTLSAERKVREKGFVVHDRKPHHLIVRPRKDGRLSKDRNGETLYALVDFELLKRTPEREEKVRRSKRGIFLEKQKGRFVHPTDCYPPNLEHVNIMGIDYVHGNVESTKGKLWVVGKDPDLFDYFLPERWEATPRVKLSVFTEFYYTLTKDDIHLVWKVSNVGSMPDMDPFNEDERRILEFGYNSPFEKVSFASYLSRSGIPTISPMAIYMAGNKVEVADYLTDESRFRSHQHLLNSDGTPVLRRDRAYVTIWRYWDLHREELRAGDDDAREWMSALNAYRKNFITREDYFSLKQNVRDRLLAVNIEDLNLRGSHFLVSLDSERRFLKDGRGEPDIRICDFELLKGGKKIRPVNSSSGYQSDP